MSNQLATIRKRIGIGWRTHDLRHRFAVDYLKAGGSIYRLKEILGHAQVSTTEIYLAHLTPDEAERAKGEAALVEDSGNGEFQPHVHWHVCEHKEPMPR